MKPVVGIFSFTGCSGCQLEVFHQEDIILELLSKVKITYFPLIQETNEMQNIDIAIVEGSISTPIQADAVKRIRQASKFVVALGACAVQGGINNLRNPLEKKGVARYVYSGCFVPCQNSSGVGEHISVDYFLRGCPPVKGEFDACLKSLLLGVKPFVYDQPVCTECRVKENNCILTSGGLCLGPVTYGGCGAVCPQNNLPCDGCRGRTPDANISALSEAAGLNKLPKKDIDRLFEVFNTK